MKPQNLTWKKLTADELTRVYLDEMRRDFPPSELKPLSMILNSEAAGMAHTWGVFAEDTLVSYLLMVRPAGCEVSQLDYFSVLPAYRSSGVGAKLLAALPAHEEGAKAILIEAECPEAELMSYAIDLRSMTQSRGSFVMHFVRYEQCSADAQAKAVAAAKAMQEAE